MHAGNINVAVILLIGLAECAKRCIIGCEEDLSFSFV